jgi:hypothetical protein
MIKKIRRALEDIRGKKIYEFEDLDPIIRRCIKDFGNLFPQLEINKRGSKVVYHFNVPEVNPISIEKQHGSRDSIPRHYAKLIIAGIDDLIAFIEEREGEFRNDTQNDE